MSKTLIIIFSCFFIKSFSTPSEQQMDANIQSCYLATQFYMANFMQLQEIKEIMHAKLEQKAYALQYIHCLQNMNDQIGQKIIQMYQSQDQKIGQVLQTLFQNSKMKDIFQPGQDLELTAFEKQAYEMLFDIQKKYEQGEMEAPGKTKGSLFSLSNLIPTNINFNNHTLCLLIFTVVFLLFIYSWMFSEKKIFTSKDMQKKKQ